VERGGDRQEGQLRPRSFAERFQGAGGTARNSLSAASLMKRGVFPQQHPAALPGVILRQLDHEFLATRRWRAGRRASSSTPMPGLTVILRSSTSRALADRAELHRRRGAVEAGGERREARQRQSNAGTIAVGADASTPSAVALDSGLPAIDRCGSAVWATRFVAGVARLGQRIGSGPGPQDPGAVHDRLPAEHEIRSEVTAATDTCNKGMCRSIRSTCAAWWERLRGSLPVPALGRAGAACRMAL